MSALPEPALIEARRVSRLFPVRSSGTLFRPRKLQRAVDSVSLTIRPGEVLALVGESGSGKTTLGRMLLGLDRPTEGSILYKGADIAVHSGGAARTFRREVQVVFQDTGGSLNPRRSIGQTVGLSLSYHLGLGDRAVMEKVDFLLDRVGLSPAHFRRKLPHELSGGQRQRVGIARALASNPALVIADEPVSALDVSVRAQILKLMSELQRESNLAYLFITHDLGVVRAMAHRVMVMHQGRAVETGTTDEVLAKPRDAYTQRLLACTPVLDPSRQQTNYPDEVEARSGKANPP